MSEIEQGVARLKEAVPRLFAMAQNLWRPVVFVQLPLEATKIKDDGSLEIHGEIGSIRAESPLELAGMVRLGVHRPVHLENVSLPLARFDAGGALCMSPGVDAGEEPEDIPF